MISSDASNGFQGYLASALRLVEAMRLRDDLISAVDNAIDIVGRALEGGSPLLVAGNGGSASDALHISGELVGKFYLDRSPLNVICLNTNVTVLTAWSNDVDFDSVFSRQVEAHAQPGAVFWGLTTSGNSENLVQAFQAAKKVGLATIAMTGTGGGAVGRLSDILIDVPSDDTPRVQEAHVLIYHYICREVEKKLERR